jgi:two-component system, NarL family, nitrate/nitrite response regulator NarL
LSNAPQFDVVGEARDGAQAIAEKRRLNPDVVVLDISMPVLSGFEAARQIMASLPETAIVMLSLNTDERFIEEAKKVGARAYVAKTEVGEKLLKAIEMAVVGGDFVLIE